MCLAALLLQPVYPKLILLDEPELGLHPAAVQLLAGMIHKASHKSQLIISTQSGDLVSCFEAKDIIVTKQEEGASIFERIEPDVLQSWLEEYTLGELWEKNVRLRTLMNPDK